MSLSTVAYDRGFPFQLSYLISPLKSEIDDTFESRGSRELHLHNLDDALKVRLLICSVTGKVPLAGFGWAMATHLSMYPVFLFIPVCTSLPSTFFAYLSILQSIDSSTEV